MWDFAFKQYTHKWLDRVLYCVSDKKKRKEKPPCTLCQARRGAATRICAQSLLWKLHTYQAVASTAAEQRMQPRIRHPRLNRLIFSRHGLWEREHLFYFSPAGCAWSTTIIWCPTSMQSHFPQAYIHHLDRQKDGRIHEPPPSFLRAVHHCSQEHSSRPIIWIRLLFACSVTSLQSTTA